MSNVTQGRIISTHVFAFYLLLLFSICSCGIIAALDPPQKRDFFKGKYDQNLFTALDSNSIFTAIDTTNYGSKQLFIWYSDGRVIKHTSFVMGSITEEECLRIFNDSVFKHDIKRYSKNEYGYFYPLNKDSFKCELMSRITIGSFHFNGFVITNKDSTSFVAKYTGSRPYKYFKTHWGYLPDTTYLYFKKKQ